MSSVTITEGDLLDALVTASAAPEDARTVAEIQQTTGIGEKRLRRAMLALQSDGRLQVHRVVRRSLDGRAVLVPAYTVTPKRKGKK